jgi:lysophospholipase L1-like esterase
VQDQLPKLAKYRPDVMTVSIGANDIAKWDPVGFERGLRTIFDAVPPHTLVADLPFFYFPQNERKVAVANEILRRLAAERGLTVVRLHRETRLRGFRRMFTHFANDMFHPNDHGYRVWADAFRPALTASLLERFPIEPDASDEGTIEASSSTEADVAASPESVTEDVAGRP